MRHISYVDVFAIEFEVAEDEDVQPGDLVRTGPNLFPTYEVVAVAGEKVWVRDVQTRLDAITFLMRCRKVNGPIDVREGGA